jgi:hypothetical protein
MIVIRRYTPPTCTLEIKAKQSPLSQWSNRPLFKDIRFELRFDDPRMIQDEQLQIIGDRTQLELLCDVVTEYTQKFLNPSSHYNYVLPTNTLEIPSQTTEEIVNNSPQSDIIVEENNETENDQENNIININPDIKEENDQENKTDQQEIKSTSNIIHIPTTPYLRSNSLISHELYFGSLAPQSSQISIKLSALQLFDLVSALDNYQNDIQALPDLSSANKASRKGVYALWRNVAGIILTVGLTTVGLRGYYEQTAPRDNEVLTEQTSESLLPSQPDVIAPAPPLPPDQADLPAFPPLKSGELLPPPDSVPVPKSNGAINGNSSPVPYSTPLPAPNLPAPPVAVKPNLPPPPPSTLPEINVPLTPIPTGEPNLPSLPSLSRGNTVPTLEGENDSVSSSPSPAIASNPPSQRNNQTGINQNSSNSETLTEIKNYFQSRWNAPEGLDRKIEYRLLINQDGAMGLITPIGGLAGIYIDRTDMPLMGEKFVSPFTYAQNITVRLVLFPDGKADVFQE